MPDKAQQKEYTGTCYIGVVGSELEIGECRDSIQQIIRRPGDDPPRFVRATKGYEARQMHLNNWIDNTQHGFALFLDHDQKFPQDTLERLRSHKKPYVSGYYLRRQYSPVAPVFFHPFTTWPFEPFIEEPERGKLLEIGASGWGCLLLHRDVVLAVRELLKGEDEIIEDDMDLWPYDLERIMAAINSLNKIVDTEPNKAQILTSLKVITKMLNEEIKPLRGVKNVVGSDIRFPFYAKAVGYTLYLDPDVRCGHMVHYPIHPDDFAGLPPDVITKTNESAQIKVKEERDQVYTYLERINGDK